MSELNDFLAKRNPELPVTVTFDMVKVADSEFWRQQGQYVGLQEYHDYRRATEELAMLKIQF